MPALPRNRAIAMTCGRAESPEATRATRDLSSPRRCLLPKSLPRSSHNGMRQGRMTTCLPCCCFLLCNLPLPPRRPCTTKLANDRIQYRWSAAGECCTTTERHSLQYSGPSMYEAHSQGNATLCCAIIRPLQVAFRAQESQIWVTIWPMLAKVQPRVRPNWRTLA